MDSKIAALWFYLVHLEKNQPSFNNLRPWPWEGSSGFPFSPGVLTPPGPIASAFSPHKRLHGHTLIHQVEFPLLLTAEEKLRFRLFSPSNSEILRQFGSLALQTLPKGGASFNENGESCHTLSLRKEMLTGLIFISLTGSTSWFLLKNNKYMNSQKIF